ncbi:MAG: hypothetical protein P9F19_09790 [Candidatus Contendobacter sp.]|nr:hypothetical protein [Candidatus Contendobacter sp.]MDG4557663.1 hypothetical protein [Candidatus Contendobacter sp.]
MKKTKLIVVSAALGFAVTGAAYADSGSHTPAQLFPNQAERVQATPASPAEMPAPRPGWNKGSQYDVEWLTGTTKARSEGSSTNQPSASTAQSAGKSCNLKPMAGFNQHNSFEHSC